MLTQSRRHFLTSIAALGLACRANAVDQLAPFRRGVSMHDAMNWGDANADKTGYVWPPFAKPSHRVPDAVLVAVRQAGFDFIRLTVDPGVFLYFDGERRTALDQMLLTQVKALKARGFGVVVDFHPTSQIAAYAPEKITESDISPLFKAYAGLLVRIGQLLSPYARQRVALEIMNEPQWGWDEASSVRWQQQMRHMHDGIRRVAPELTLILSGARGGDIDGLIQIDPAPYKDSNVLWSFHYYQPYLLTHQGVKATEGQGRLWRYFSDLPFPASPDMLAHASTMLRANIMADQALSPREQDRMFNDAERALREYLNSKPGRARIAADFAKLDAWAQKNNVPRHRLFMGEFGITRTYGPYKASPPEPLMNWISAVRDEAETRDIGWAFWVLSGYGGMSLVETDGSAQLDRPTLKALGLNG